MGDSSVPHLSACLPCRLFYFGVGCSPLQRCAEPEASLTAWWGGRDEESCEVQVRKGAPFGGSVKAARIAEFLVGKEEDILSDPLVAVQGSRDHGVNRL